MSDEITIRTAEEVDAAAILALTRAAYAKWVPIIGREPKPMRADYTEILRKDHVHMLSVGTAFAALVHTVRETDHLLIYNIAVAPEYQGKGLGRRLLAYCDELARTLGYVEIRLYTNKAFAENVRLYQSFGYTIDREEPFMNGFTVYMSKALAQRT